MNYDIMAIGVHPDDVELGCSGTLVAHIQKGQKVVIVDLTEGDLGSRGTVETRYEEASNAAKVLGITDRVNLKFRDGFFENDEAHKLEVIKVIRHFRPRIIICNAPSDRHPDHGRASKLVEDAWFLSGLIKIKTQYDHKIQDSWRAKAVYHYIQDRNIPHQFVVNISVQMDAKLESIKCYKTQFSENDGDSTKTYISRPGFLEQIIARSKVWGHSIGAEYGEAFSTSFAIGLKDLDGLYLPDLS